MIETPTACDINDFWEGLEARRELMKKKYAECTAEKIIAWKEINNK